MTDHEPSTSPAGQPLAGAPRATSAHRRRSLCLLVSAATLFAAGGALTWWMQTGESSSVSGRPHPVATPKTGVVSTEVDSHRALPAYTADGQETVRPADPALEDALSLTSRLPLEARLKTLHALLGRQIGPDNSAFMRAFVAHKALPEGLDIRQVRALKNDVLNVLCQQPGEEHATAAVLRELYADRSADGGLRDYALQHLVSLIERVPDIGWQTHWTAVDSDEPALAATAMIHLSLRQRRGGLTTEETTRLGAAALRIVSSDTAKGPARTTALQVCGRLQVTDARPLAHAIARDERAGFPLRIAAVATLGDLGGDAEAQAYLTGLTTGPEKRLRIPAQSALQRFTSN